MHIYQFLPLLDGFYYFQESFSGESKRSEDVFTYPVKYLNIYWMEGHQFLCICGYKALNPDDFGDPLTFPIAPSAKLQTFPSASAVLCLYCKLTKVGMLTH